MNYLNAKLIKEEEYKKILETDAEIFEPLSNEMREKSVEYSPSYKLEDDEIFCLSDFKKESFCLELLKAKFNSVVYREIDTSSLNQIDYLFAYQNDENYYFQRISNKNIVKGKSLYLLGDKMEINNKNSIILNEFADAVYFSKEDKLFFKNIGRIIRIFSGIDSLYQVAKDEEVSDFLRNDFIKLVNGFDYMSVKEANRRRIAILNDRVKSLSNEQKKEVIIYIQEYCKQIAFHDNAFDIGNEQDLKNLLYGIDERYYTTPVTKEKRLANSVIAISENLHA